MVSEQESPKRLSGFFFFSFVFFSCSFLHPCITHVRMHASSCKQSSGSLLCSKVECVLEQMKRQMAAHLGVSRLLLPLGGFLIRHLLLLLLAGPQPAGHS